MGKSKVEIPPTNPGTVKYTNTFSFLPAMGIGEPYNDKIIVAGTAKGKQMKGGRYHGKNEQTKIASEATQKTGNGSTSLFSIEPSLFCTLDKNKKGPAEPYIDNDRYRERFPNGDFRPKNCKKIGFMTADFRAVDKYASTINTDRLRETLKKETNLARKVKRENDQRFGELGLEQTVAVQAQGSLAPQKLYDVVHRQLPTSFKHARDDRQMSYFYMNQRRKELGAEPHPIFHKLHGLETMKLHSQDHVAGAGSRTSFNHKEAQWVQVTLATGAQLNVLVDEHDRIVAQRYVGEHDVGGML